MQNNNTTHTNIPTTSTDNTDDHACMQYYLKTYGPEGTLAAVEFTVGDTVADLVWVRGDQIAFDVLDIDAVEGVTVEQIERILNLVQAGVAGWGANFVGVRLLAIDDPNNTRLAVPNLSSPFVAYKIATPPAWLAVRS